MAGSGRKKKVSEITPAKHEERKIAKREERKQFNVKKLQDVERRAMSTEDLDAKRQTKIAELKRQMIDCRGKGMAQERQALAIVRAATVQYCTHHPEDTVKAEEASKALQDEVFQLKDKIAELERQLGEARKSEVTAWGSQQEAWRCAWNIAESAQELMADLAHLKAENVQWRTEADRLRMSMQ